MNEAPADFLHRQALGLVRQRPLSFVRDDSEPRAAPQLLGAQRRDVDKQESAVDGRSGFRGNLRSVFDRLLYGVVRVDVAHTGQKA